MYVLTSWQIMIWDQAQAGNRAIKTRRHTMVMSASLLGSHLSTPFLFRPGKLYLAIKLAASLSEATASGGFGSGLLLRTSHV
jgi:hypothetical protein